MQKEFENRNLMCPQFYPDTSPDYSAETPDCFPTDFRLSISYNEYAGRLQPFIESLIPLLGSRAFLLPFSRQYLGCARKPLDWFSGFFYSAGQEKTMDKKQALAAQEPSLSME